MRVKYEKFNLVNEKGMFLAYTLSSFTVKRADAFWSTSGGIDALVKEFPDFGKLTRINVNDTPVVVESTGKSQPWTSIRKGIVGGKRKHNRSNCNGN